MELNFDFFYNWARKELGLDLNSYKEKQLQRRISTIMRISGTKNLEEYTRMMEADHRLKNKFLDYITINVTDF